MKKIGFLLISVMAINGCTAVSPEASKVLLLKSSSPMLSQCERLGIVTGSGSGWKPRLNYDSWSGVSVDAQNEMRENAYEKYKADAVVLVNVDKQLTRMVAQGMAYKCSP